MHKLRLVILFLILNFSLLVFSVHAENTVEIGQSLIYPAQPFYFLKTIRERLEQTFALSFSAKAMIQVDFTARRLRETNTLILNNRQDLIEQTLEKYRREIKTAFDLSAEDTGLRSQISDSFYSQIPFLINLYDKSNDQYARRALRASVIEVSQRVANQPAACQFLDQASQDQSIWESERSILKQKAQNCQDLLK